MTTLPFQRHWRRFFPFPGKAVTDLRNDDFFNLIFVFSTKKGVLKFLLTLGFITNPFLCKEKAIVKQQGVTDDFFWLVKTPWWVYDLLRIAVKNNHVTNRLKKRFSFFQFNREKLFLKSKNSNKFSRPQNFLTGYQLSHISLRWKIKNLQFFPVKEAWLCLFVWKKTGSDPHYCLFGATEAANVPQREH